MRVLMIPAVRPTHPDGWVSARVEALSRALQERGHRVIMLAPGPETPQPKSLSAWIGQRYRVLRQQGPLDVIHIHGPLGLVPALREERIPIVASLHSIPRPPEHVTPLWKRVKRHLGRHLEFRRIDLLVRLADSLICASPFVKSCIEAYNVSFAQHRLWIIPPGMESIPSPQKTRKTLKADMGLHDNLVVAVAVRGRSGVAMQGELQALMDFLRVKPAVRLLTIGPPSVELDECLSTNQANDQVLRIEDAETEQAIQTADLFVNLTHEFITFDPLTNLALSHRTPMICTRETTATGLVGPEEACLFSTPPQLMQHLETLARDISRRRVLADKGYRAARESTTDAIVPQIESVYAQTRKRKLLPPNARMISQLRLMFDNRLLRDR